MSQEETEWEQSFTANIVAEKLMRT
jgi:hypothetical protein